MAKIKWDESGERLYETGVEQGVLYLVNDDGDYNAESAGWNGLINVTESPSGAEATALWADNIKYLNLLSAEEFGATIEAYTYPDEFAKCDGSAEVANVPGVYIGQQGRKKFGFCYKTLLGNDVDGTDYGYKLHLIYGCTASPSEKAYGTVNDSPEAITFSWEVTTVPEKFVVHTDYKPTACLTIKSTDFKTTEEIARLTALEDMLYGSDDYVEAGNNGTEEVTSTNFASIKANLYIKSGTDYVSVSTGTYDGEETYYYNGSDAFLPKPDDVITALSA